MTTNRNLGEVIGDFVTDVMDSIGIGGYPHKLEFTKRLNIDLERYELAIRSYNGSIELRTHDYDDILIDVKIASKYSDIDESMVKIKDTGSTLIIDTDKIKRTSVSYKVTIPRVTLKEAALLTSNGRIELIAINAQAIKAATSNGRINIIDSNSDFIDLSSSNGRIELEECRGVEVVANTSNGAIKIIGSDIRKLRATTSNGSISTKDIRVNSDATYELKTSNGAIRLGCLEEVPYRIDATTTNGKINNSFASSGIGSSGRGFLQTESKNFNNSNERIYVKAHTSNGSISLGLCEN